MDPMGSESQNSGTLRKTVTAVPPENGAKNPQGKALSSIVIIVLGRAVDFLGVITMLF